MPNKISMLNRLKPVRKLVVLALLHLALLPVASAIACDAESMVTSLTMRHGIGARPGVVHGTFHNKSANELKLVAVDSDMFARIEIHTMGMDKGIMRMRRLDALSLPAGETITLEPGGLHLMLFGYRGDARNEAVSLSLTMLDGEGKKHNLNVSVTPKTVTPKTMQQNGHNNGHHGHH